MKSNKQFRFYVLCNCLLVGIFLLFIANQSLATTYCVADEAELIAALDAAEGNGEDDVIKVQQRTYDGNFVYTSTESFGVTIEGGYTVGCVSRTVDPINTVLDGDEAGVVLALSAPGVAANFVVDGLTIMNGNVTDSGGGLFINTSGGDITVRKNFINNNSAGINGGGLYTSNARSLTISDSSINSNTS